ncbi:MAG: hypothetical protein E6J72_04320 [Deltaproteobacteria bacterium]|nr:MAG: hypothetical protein E6J72_04320 [Deltaproteobacteria bacterium]
MGVVMFGLEVLVRALVLRVDLFVLGAVLAREASMQPPMLPLRHWERVRRVVLTLELTVLRLMLTVQVLMHAFVLLVQLFVQRFVFRVMCTGADG